MTPVVIPLTSLPGPGASLADLVLRAIRIDGSSYLASTRPGFWSPAARVLIGRVGATPPIRVDRVNPSRIAIDVAASGAGRED